MKLGKLLAAGKSIMRGHREISYRSSKQIYLPKFGSSKNPFTSERPAPAAEVMPPETPETMDSERAPRPTRLAPAHEPLSGAASAPRCGSEAPSNRIPDGAPSARMPDCSAPSQSSTRNSQPKQSSHSSRVAPKGVVRSLGPLRALASVLRSAVPPHKIRRFENTMKPAGGAPLQTELSLDSVKVVHNDLSDVDVEVVPIKSRTGAAELPAPKKAWEFVGERLFGVEAT